MFYSLYCQFSCFLQFTESIDELLDICFKCALKSSIKKSDLPLLTSSFFKNHMVKYWLDMCIIFISKIIKCNIRNINEK